MINLLFFNPLNLFPIVHLVRRDLCPHLTYVAFTAGALQGERGMTPQLAEMTSKCFLPQPSTNDQSLALGGDPSSAKGQQGNTNSGAKQRANFSPAGEAAVNGTLLRRGGPWDGSGGRSRHVRLRDEASLTALTCLLEVPGADIDTGTSHRCLGRPLHSHRLSLNRVTSEPQEAE